MRRSILRRRRSVESISRKQMSAGSSAPTDYIDNTGLIPTDHFCRSVSIAKGAFVEPQGQIPMIGLPILRAKLSSKSIQSL